MKKIIFTFTFLISNLLLSDVKVYESNDRSNGIATTIQTICVFASDKDKTGHLFIAHVSVPASGTAPNNTTSVLLQVKKSDKSGDAKFVQCDR